MVSITHERIQYLTEPSRSGAPAARSSMWPKAAAARQPRAGEEPAAVDHLGFSSASRRFFTSHFTPWSHALRPCCP